MSQAEGQQGSRMRLGGEKNGEGGSGEKEQREREVARWLGMISMWLKHEKIELSGELKTLVTLTHPPS